MKWWYNPIVKWVLRSPLHGLLSRYFTIVTYTGRKSGGQFSVPVNYARHDDALTIVSQRERVWWRNLYGGAHVSVRLRGKERPGEAEVVTDGERVGERLLTLSRADPRYARGFGITLDADGRPTDLAQVARAARDRVAVWIQLD